MTSKLWTMTDLDGENIADDIETSRHMPAAIEALGNNIVKALNTAYPKWAGTWFVRIDTRGGIVQIQNTAFSGEMGFILHITKIDPEMRRVREMAGELFERYNIARHRALDVKQALADLERNALGQAKYET